MIPWLEVADDFPPVGRALTEPSGLLAAGADLSPGRLLTAYRNGIFPWYSAGQPILWWSPDPRMVLFPAAFRTPRSLVKRLRRQNYEIRIDTAFEAVMHACAAPRQHENGTWITPDIIAAYCELHRLGHAHSVETWIDGGLAGGLYGIALGRAFYGESMFTCVPDASKIALAHLVRLLHHHQFGIIDCQMNTAHLARFGAREIPRSTFLLHLAKLVNCPVSAEVWRHHGETVTW